MIRKPLVATLLSLFLAACGSSIEGVYSGKDTGFLDQIEIKGDHKVELMFMGMLKEGTYEIEGDRIKINNAGEINILRIDGDGCLDGGGILGRYCKGEGRSAPSSTSSVKPAHGSPGLVGSRFAAGPAGDEWILEFLDDSVVRMVIDGDSEKLEYVTRGGDIIVRGMDGQELVLVPRGNDLEGGPDGMVMLFKKRS